MNRRPLALLTALATIGVCSPVPLGADTLVIKSKRDSLSPTPRAYGGEPVSAGELLRMRRKNARKRR